MEEYLLIVTFSIMPFNLAVYVYVSDLSLEKKKKKRKKKREQMKKIEFMVLLAPPPSHIR